MADRPKYDGIKLMVDLTLTIRRHITRPGFLLSHAPQSPYLALALPQIAGDPPREDFVTNPGYYGSYLAILARLGTMGPTTIDFLNTQFYNQWPMLDKCPLGYYYSGVNSYIVNNLYETCPAPCPMWPVFGTDLYIPQCLPANILYGQKIPEEPVIRPWCVGKGPAAEIKRGTGHMLWLDSPSAEDFTTASDLIKSWYPPTLGDKSPPVRVAFYNNEFPVTIPGPEEYSPYNVFIIGFMYAVMNNSNAPTPVPPTPPFTLAPWAIFRMSYGTWDADLRNPENRNRLLDWRGAEPGRKIMVGVGGVQWLAAPLWDVWAESQANLEIVGAGFAEFLTYFNDTYGFEIDGIDIDYEDSDNLNPLHDKRQRDKYERQRVADCLSKSGRRGKHIFSL